MSTENTALYAMLSNLAESLGIAIKEDSVEGGKGGLYIFKGKRNIVLSKTLPVDQKVDILIEILRKEDISNMFVIPALRDVLGK
jgi:hypothetical protein